MTDFNKNANPQASPPAILHTITSDVGGTLSFGKVVNIPLIHYLLDAAERGHEVYIVTMGNTGPAKDIFELCCAMANRDQPPSIKILSKFDLKDIANDVTIAFDDQEIDYLGKAESLIHAVSIGATGTPSVSYEALRRMTGTTNSPYAGTPLPTLATAPKAL